MTQAPLLMDLQNGILDRIGADRAYLDRVVETQQRAERAGLRRPRGPPGADGEGLPATGGGRQGRRLARVSNPVDGCGTIGAVPWTCPEPPPDPDAPDVGDLRPILQGYLDHFRLTLLRLCAGLTADQLAARPLPSSLSLLGLVRHMAKVERRWWRIRAAGEDVPALFPAPDEDFDDLDPRTAQQAVTDLQAEWAACDAAVAGLPMGHVLEANGEPLSLGSLYVHLVEEYARHDGHADLMREAIDGVTGR